jgi:ketosteroid isomerase-like protein
LTLDPSTIETIEQFNTQFADALGRADVSAIADMFTQDAVVLPPRRNTVTGENIRKYFLFFAQQTQSPKLLTSTLDPLNADVVREVGIISFRTRGENTERVTGRYFFLWQRVGDGWKINSFIWTRNAQANPSAQRTNVSGV